MTRAEQDADDTQGTPPAPTLPLPRRAQQPDALVGCGSHSCVIAKPQGMGTNGLCTCEEPALRRALRAERARADAAEAVLARVALLAAELRGGR